MCQNNFLDKFGIIKGIYLPCCPVFVPQITGGTLPPGPVRENVSVRQLLAKVTGMAPTARGTILPPISVATLVAMVVGPAMTKVLKSIRI